MARVMEIVTPLGADVLLFHRMNAREEMSRLFEYELDLLSKKGDINLDDILAKSVTVKLELPERKTRHFNGYVTRFAQVGMHGRYHLYRAAVRPWLWFLTRSAELPHLPGHDGAGHHQEGVRRAQHRRRQAGRSQRHLSQARCTACSTARRDFNFVSRLMEEEGIYYYFKHERGQAHPDAVGLLQRTRDIRRLRQDSLRPPWSAPRASSRNTSTNGR